MLVPRDGLYPQKWLYPDEGVRKGSRGRRLLRYPEEPAPIVAKYDDDEEIIFALITGFVKAMK